MIKRLTGVGFHHVYGS